MLKGKPGNRTRGTPPHSVNALSLVDMGNGAQIWESVTIYIKNTPSTKETKKQRPTPIGSCQKGNRQLTNKNPRRTPSPHDVFLTIVLHQNLYHCSMYLCSRVARVCDAVAVLHVHPGIALFLQWKKLGPLQMHKVSVGLRSQNIPIFVRYQAGLRSQAHPSGASCNCRKCGMSTASSCCSMHCRQGVARQIGPRPMPQRIPKEGPLSKKWRQLYKACTSHV